MPRKKPTKPSDISEATLEIKAAFDHFMGAWSVISGRFKETDLIMLKMKKALPALRELQTLVPSEMRKQISS